MIFAIFVVQLAFVKKTGATDALYITESSAVTLVRYSHHPYLIFSHLFNNYTPLLKHIAYSSATI